MAKPRIALVPYGTPIDRTLGVQQLADMQWPLGPPPDTSGRLGDLGPEDHVLIYPKTSMYLSPPRLRAKLSVMVVEPRAIHGRHLALLRLFGGRFHRVFTHDPRMLRRVNARFLPAASTWVPDYANLDLTKTKGVSMIVSGKGKLPGHRLRHQLAEGLEGVDLMGRAHAPFEDKGAALAPYRYTVVIENVRSPGYFSEKLIDALLCEVVPIYWGAPDVTAYFDARALMRCESLSELRAAIARADEGLYDALRPAMGIAKAQAERLQDYRALAARTLADEG
ncbi:MAG: hypothetical protein AAGM84_16965 [Pseudomonadota bacterium]